MVRTRTPEVERRSRTISTSVTIAEQAALAQLTKDTYIRRRALEQLVKGRDEDLDRFHKGEGGALDKTHPDSAPRIERPVSEAHRRGLPNPPDLAQRDIGRAARETKERAGSITRIPPRPPRPRGSKRGCEGFGR